MGRRKTFKKEEDSEDWCFQCKDGGEFRICDYRKCVKVYHPKCVGKDKSFLQAETKWNCDWHFCHVCRNFSKFYCFCCPTGVCKKCLYYARFAVVRGDKGLCNSCLELAWLIETKKDINSNGCKTDMNDLETTKFYFKDYWQMIKRKERLTSENVISAYDLLKKGEMHKRASSAFDFDEVEEDTDGIEDESLFNISDYNDSTDIEELSFHRNRKRKRSKGKMAGKNEQSSSKDLVTLHNCIGKATEVEGERRFSQCMDSLPPLQMILEQPQLLHEAPVVIADTQQQQQMPSDKTLLLHEIPNMVVDAQDVEPACKDWTRTNEKEDDDGLPESSPGRICKGNETSCHMPLEKLQHEAQEVPIVITNAQNYKSTCKESKRTDEHNHNDGLTESSPGRTSACNVMAFHENCSPNVAGSSSRPSAAVSKSHQEATPVLIVDSKNETTEDINPLLEQVDFFSKLQPLLDESVKNLPGSSQQLPHALDQQKEALHCLQECCSMSFEQLMNHDQMEYLLYSINILLMSGYFPDDMLGIVTKFQLNFLINRSLYSHCLENVKKADEEYELTKSLRRDLAEKKIRFHQTQQCIKATVDNIDELQKQLREQRNYHASLREESTVIYKSSIISGKVLSQSIQSSKILEKCKESSQQYMKEIDDSWTKFKNESSKLLQRFGSGY